MVYIAPVQAPTFLRVNVAPNVEVRQRVQCHFWGEGPQGAEAGSVKVTLDSVLRAVSQNAGYTRWRQTFRTTVHEATGELAPAAKVFEEMNGFRMMRVTDPLNRAIKLETEDGLRLPNNSSFEVQLPRNAVSPGSTWTIPLTASNTKTSATFTYRGMTQGLHRVDLVYGKPLTMPEGFATYFIDPQDGLPRYGRALFSLEIGGGNELYTRYILDRGTPAPDGLFPGK